MLRKVDACRARSAREWEGVPSACYGGQEPWVETHEEASVACRIMQPALVALSAVVEHDVVRVGEDRPAAEMPDDDARRRKDCARTSVDRVQLPPEWCVRQAVEFAESEQTTLVEDRLQSSCG